eukprot:5389139-Prymnesium_polylepis.1
MWVDSPSHRQTEPSSEPETTRSFPGQKAARTKERDVFMWPCVGGAVSYTHLRAHETLMNL